ncbi:PalH-domain-containing protein [Eremomyces bilateralis CBS 781.70]|uniref:PalH-domain-containing protein n=1 Tax=Eremomyces bilateralis CBS 781.70 TaxID=1392243 RepID=A0A6G1GDI3_9PEZI|nr:PalH-domain-containing protein [Eremomyces bilateralis CBS 781.70]KAF1815951.1 PalH-domain-containing protein [Eremomyces bilateralis CBS 781.70]
MSDGSNDISCTPIPILVDGLIVLNPTSTITIPAGVLFTPDCTSSPIVDPNSVAVSGISNAREPFHASVIPQTYATAAATVIAWMLVVMLLITPRTFFANGATPFTGLLGRRGMISGATGGASVIGVGSRPWLQKVAALTVAVSLSIATADTFKVASRQYDTGFMDAAALRDQVVDSTEIKVSRVVSDIFLWLAQVQTLIRLFPRHKEKVLIKWIGFALILLDGTFSCLNTFMGNPVGRPRRFVDAIPALTYLFQLALSMLYAAWVIYYSITKRRYAFYHSMMWNISVVALLSIVAILTPVVFFITDISDATVAGWGDYFRWVGAAAASVIVWEWVERIEALEREDKKDGILGREVFDGDEMLDVTASEEINWPQNRYERAESKKKNGGNGGSRMASSTGASRNRFGQWNELSHRFRRPSFWPHISPPANSSSEDATQITPPKESYNPAVPARTRVPRTDQTETLPPQTSASPVSRSDATSAASTVYAVRYHTISPLDRHRPLNPSRPPVHPSTSQSFPDPEEGDLEKAHVEPQEGVDQSPHRPQNRSGWQIVTEAFRRKRNLPPAEIATGQVIDPIQLSKEIPAPRLAVPSHNYSVWDVKGRLGAFAAEQGEKLRDRRDRRQDNMLLPVMIIPVQPKGSRAWSPETIQPPLPTTESGNPNGPSPADAVEHGSQTPAIPIHPSTPPLPTTDSLHHEPLPSSGNTNPRHTPNILNGTPAMPSSPSPPNSAYNQEQRSLSPMHLTSPHPLPSTVGLPHPQPSTLQSVDEEGEYETLSRVPQLQTGAPGGGRGDRVQDS